MNEIWGGCSIIQDWGGDVWLNPPYGKEIVPFIDKFLSHKKGVMLIFARMGNKDVHRCIRSGATLFLFRKRIKFISKELVQKTNAGTDSMLVFFDEKYINRAHKLGGVFVKKLN